MAEFRETPDLSVQVDGAYALYALMMVKSDGQYEAATAAAGIGGKIAGHLLERSYAADEWKTVRTLNAQGTQKGIASGAVTDLTVPLTAAAAGALESGGAGVPIGMPLQTAVDGEILQYRPFAGAGSEPVTHLTDPGDAGAISVSGYEDGYLDLVTEGAETRTLADPSKPGQRLTINLKTDGGDAVLTAASPVNNTGNNTITFSDVTDVVFLQAVSSGDDPKWRVVGSDGAALTTV